MKGLFNDNEKPNRHEYIENDYAEEEYAEEPEEYGYCAEEYAEEPEEYGYCAEEYAEEPEEYGYCAEEYAEEPEEYEYCAEEEYVEEPPLQRREFRQRRRKQSQPRQKNIGLWGKLRSGVSRMDVMDRVMLGTGAAVLILALVSGSVFVSARIVEGQMADFVSVGAQLEGINVIGESGLLAVADAEQARLAAAAALAEEQKKEYNENNYDRQISVAPGFTSIQKDLKIKFINRKTGKLVPNVPFSVTVTDPDGRNYIWSDDDMDGIIYKKDITPGSYQITMEELTDSQYSDYVVSAVTQTAVVQAEITYKKVDVKDEVKKESEVNAAREDTRKNETVVESTLADTVEWVESKVIAATYHEISRNEIPDPAAVALNGTFLRRSGGTELQQNTQELNLTTEETADAAEEPALAPTETPAEEPTEMPTEEPALAPTETPAEEPTPAPTEMPTEEPALAPTETPTEEPALAPTAEPTPEPTAEPSLAPSPAPTATPEPVKGNISVSTGAMTVLTGRSLTAVVTASEFTPGRNIVYSAVSDNVGVAAASIDGAGNLTVTGIAAGAAVITVTANYEGGDALAAAAAAVAVTVGGNKTIALDKTAATVFLTAPVVINAEVTNAMNAGQAVTAESSDVNVAEVSVEGRAVTVVGVNPGSAVVTIKYNENGEEVSAACTVTVKTHPRDDYQTRLKDASGNQLYVLENNTYREAAHADYYSADKFFLKGGVRYSGWQTIEGKVYYFTADGNKVTGEQVIQGAKYNFAGDGSLMTGDGIIGIDVSKWNGTIDWNAVKNSGISYVIIRCGYRGSSEGRLIEDPKFETNIKGAAEAGLKVGVYFFTQAVDEVEAVEEASMVLEQIKNYKISYPVFLDVETSGGRGDGIDRETRTAVCKAFCRTIENAGYTAGIYSNKLWLEGRLNASELNGYKIWLAQYAATPTYTGRYDIWQYKADGCVSGISGNVDLNISYMGY